MNRIAGFVNYYQYVTWDSKPYVVIAFGQGDLGYHGVNRDISVNTLNYIPSITTASTATSTSTLDQDQLDNWNIDRLNFINLMRHILEILLNFFNNLRVN